MSYTEKRHPKAMQRHNDFVHQHRKEYIIKHVYHNDSFYNKMHGHRLNKQKIHCSCPLCSTKTKNIGYSRRDTRLHDSYKNQIQSLNG